MKRVSIITILDNNNFGTFLQAFALCKKIEELGYVPELVDYCRPQLRYLNVWKRLLRTIHNPLRLLSRTFSLLESYRTHAKDRKFIRQYLSPKTYYSSEQVRESILPADVYMTGSDQVWNSIHNQGLDKTFYLDYAPAGAKKVAYAASIGMPEFQDWEKEETRRLLEDYEHITVREESAIGLIESLGMDASRIKTVLDPTLLLNKEQWKKFITKQRIHKERYLLVYSVEEKAQAKIIDSVARKIAQERGLKIVGVYYGGEYGRIECCDYNHYHATPDIFLSLIYHADFVVVSSFHGTAFSINFEKDFYTIAPNRFNSRVANILKLLSLENRLITSSEQEIDSCQKINYKEVNSEIDSVRRESVNVLKTMLNI